MARGDLVLKLVQAGISGDKKLFEKTTQAIISEEKAKDHHILASRIEERLNKGKNKNSAKTYYLKSKKIEEKPVIERTPGFSFDDLILSDNVRNACDELIEEQRKVSILRSHNIEPRHRVLLVGPPGNGKTSLAEALANSLMVPLYVVSYEQLITSYLGETAKKINEIFEYASNRNCVLFFDEFDVLGKERGDNQETGEIKRVVSSLLLQVDALPSNVIVVTATNHPELLDRAVWRRFQIKLNLDYPGIKEIIKWFDKFERDLGRSLYIDKSMLANKLKGLSFAEIKEFSMDIYRRLILADDMVEINEIVTQRLEQWETKLDK